MTLNQALIVAAIVFMLGTSVFFYLRQDIAQNANGTAQVQTTNPAASNTSTTTKPATKPAPAGATQITSHIYANISTLSPIKPAAGKKFSVTRVAFPASAPMSGNVEYTDGTKKYVADFSYTVDQAGKATLSSFNLRK